MQINTNLIYLILIIILVYLICNYNNIFSDDTVLVRSTVDNRRYKVLNKKDGQLAANQLALLRQKLKQFVTQLKLKHANDNRIARLSSKFKPDNFSEGNNNGSFTSYSINKGEKIVFCLRQRNEHDDIIDINTITFVALHELSHVMTVSVGRTQEFWENFKFLLKEAVDMNVYQYQNFHLNPQKYCGITITNTPLGNQS